MKTIKAPIKKELFTYDTYVTSQATSGVGTLTVKSIANFAVNQVLLIGDLGGAGSEIIKTHATTAPTGTTITLASNLVFTHPIYTKIQVLAYDQVEFSKAATITGVKTVMATSNINAASLETIYQDSTATSGYYFYRFKNSISTTYSDYSDPIPFDGFDFDTVETAIRYALKRNKLSSYTEMIDFPFCIEEINNCLRYISGKLKRWSKLQNFDYVLGQTSRGINEFTLPTDIWETENNKSILNVRIGKNYNLKWLSKEDWDIYMYGVKKTQVRTEATAGATTLEIDNSYDFLDTGSVTVFLDGDLHEITYTGVTRSATAGVLTGIPATGTGSITETIAVGTNVWQGQREGFPAYYTVFGGKLYVWYLPDATSENLNVYMDYYTAPDTVDSEGDKLDAFRYEAVKYWLTASIRDQIKNDGRKDLKDGDYVWANQIISDYLRNEVGSHRKKNWPRPNGIIY